MSTTLVDSKVADLLFGKTRGEILGLLYGRPDEAFYFQQIRRQIAAAGVGAVQREVRKLLDAGLVQRSEVGNQVFYRANRDNPIFPELRAIVSKTVGAFQVLRMALEPFAKQIEIAFVYGSVARQDDNAASDVDVMIVGKIELEQLVEPFAEAEKILARPVNPTLYSSSEFKAKLRGGNHFLSAVLSGEKFFLLGDESELRAIREERVDRRGADKRR